MGVCGIFGCFLKRPLTDEDINLCRRGRGSLRHRGPDGEGEWFDREAGIYLGHVRLSILDLTDEAAQPMQRGKYVLAYNGVIYNFRELRSELEDKGVVFRSTGDTEVLLRSWEYRGEEVLERLDGMFAFTIWDGRKAYLCVDPFGEKTVYWCETGDGIYVSSELNTLTQLLRPEVDLSEEVIASYLSLGYVPKPRTAFKNVFHLQAASIVCIQDGEIERQRTYWKYPFGKPGRGRIQTIGKKEEDRILEALIESLRGRLLSDVPLCLFLSSGVDSPLVAAIAKEELGICPRCLTVSFPRGNVPNEAPRASRIAGYLGLEFEEVESNEDPSEANAEIILSYFGQPSGNVTVISCFQVSQAAAKKYKVAVTGMGGDEVFYGYEKHSFFYRYRHLYALPKSIRLLAGRLSDSRLFSRTRIRHFGPLLGVHEHEFYVANKNYPCIEWLRTLPGFDSWAQEEFGRHSSPIELRAPAYEISQVMQNTHLPALDLGSMRASLELRTPFLNRKLVNAVAEIDPRVFLAFGQKWVLRRILSRYVPEKMIEKRKLGFIFPGDRFLTHFGGGDLMIRGLPQDLMRYVLERKGTLQGWNQLAVRLIVLSEFFRLCG